MAGLTLEVARRLLDAGEAEARERGLALAFAIVDAGGHLLALHRMDGANWITSEIALGKAWTAAAFRTPSAEQGEKSRRLPTFAAAITTATHGRYTPQVGALPIVLEGAACGAMGASGASGEEDEAVVRAALEAVR